MQFPSAAGRFTADGSCRMCFVIPARLIRRTFPLFFLVSEGPPPEGNTLGLGRMRHYSAKAASDVGAGTARRSPLLPRFRGPSARRKHPRPRTHGTLLRQSRFGCGCGHSPPFPSPSSFPRAFRPKETPAASDAKVVITPKPRRMRVRAQPAGCGHSPPFRFP